jgi:hypothetical protein
VLLERGRARRPAGRRRLRRRHPADGRDKANPKGAVEGALGWLTMRSVRAISGMKTSPSLLR